jgi:hypothetical protein
MKAEEESEEDEEMAKEAELLLLLREGDPIDPVASPSRDSPSSTEMDNDEEEMDFVMEDVTQEKQGTRSSSRVNKGSHSRRGLPPSSSMGLIASSAKSMLGHQVRNSAVPLVHCQ